MHASKIAKYPIGQLRPNKARLICPRNKELCLSNPVVKALKFLPGVLCRLDVDLRLKEQSDVHLGNRQLPFCRIRLHERPQFTIAQCGHSIEQLPSLQSQQSRHPARQLHAVQVLILISKNMCGLHLLPDRVIG